MALNFPADPALNETYPVNGVIYTWDGVKWTSKGEYSTEIPIIPDENGNVVITGTLTVQGATITGNALTVTDITGDSASLSGDLSAANGTLSGNLSAVNSNLTGNLSAVNATLSNTVSAVTGTLSGDLSANNASLGGDLTVTGDINDA